MIEYKVFTITAEILVNARNFHYYESKDLQYAPPEDAEAAFRYEMLGVYGLEEGLAKILTQYASSGWQLDALTHASADSNSQASLMTYTVVLRRFTGKRGEHRHSTNY